MGKFGPRKIQPAGEPGKTVQADARDTNINKIIEKAYKTGYLPPSRLEPMYADFSNIGTYLEATIKVQEAKEAFSKLPAKVRLRFGNSPAKLLTFMQDENNLSEAVELGLVEKQAPKAPEEPKKEEKKPAEKPAEKGAA